jgi:quercetin dioxygenase-like cupin family protein
MGGAIQRVEHRAKHLYRMVKTVSGVYRAGRCSEREAPKPEDKTMDASFTYLRWSATVATLAVVTAFVLGVVYGASSAESGAEVKQVRAEKLPNDPGKSVTAVVVKYAPGGKSSKHHHAGSVLAYVLSGAIRSQNSATGPAKVYKAGESFFEPPGSEHLVSENASATQPASLLAVFVADDGAPLTTFDK